MKNEIRTIILVAQHELKQLCSQKFFIAVMLLLSICSVTSVFRAVSDWLHVIDSLPNFPMLTLCSSAYAMFFLFFVLNYSMSLFRSVNADKESRLSEFYISFVSPSTLMTGKVLAYTLLCFFQLLAMELVAFVLLSPHCEALLNLIFMQLFRLIGMTVGFVFYMSLLALAASWVERHAETQGVILLISVLLVVSYLLPNYCQNLDTLFLSVPFTAPFVMVRNMTILSFFSMIISLLSIWLLLIFSGKIYKKRLFYFGKNEFEKR